ncbi:hypothetical protein GCM10025858_24060 [Alicyclobacillus sacchari]|nr:hypothetical protein GCM10025858_24060 [Alicyclobacillus sacchari]
MSELHPRKVASHVITSRALGGEERALKVFVPRLRRGMARSQSSTVMMASNFSRMEERQPLPTS